MQNGESVVLIEDSHAEHEPQSGPSGTASLSRASQCFAGGSHWSVGLGAGLGTASGVTSSPANSRRRVVEGKEIVSRSVALFDDLAQRYLYV